MRNHRAVARRYVLGGFLASIIASVCCVGPFFFAGHRPECGMDGATYGHGNVSTPIFFAGNWRVCDRGLEVVSGSPATG